jgi:hypothetical protein
MSASECLCLTCVLSVTFAAYRMSGHPILFVKQIPIKKGYRSLSPFKTRRKLAMQPTQFKEKRKDLPPLPPVPLTPPAFKARITSTLFPDMIPSFCDG